MMLSTGSKRKELDMDLYTFIRDTGRTQRLSISEIERRADVYSLRTWKDHEPGVYKAARVAAVLGMTVDELLRRTDDGREVDS